MNSNQLSIAVWARVIAIISIVCHHCICVFKGWPPNTGISEDVSGLWFVTSGFLKCGGLKLFAFLAGWFSFTSYEKNGSPVIFILNKVKRILIPCVLFAGLYWILFPQYAYESPLRYVNGTHLWWLPMVFCWFVFCPVLSALRRQGVIYSITGAFIFEIVLKCLCLMVTFRTIRELTSFWEVLLVGWLLAQCKDIDKAFSQKVWVPQWALLISSCSFEMYLIHQFVINALISPMKMIMVDANLKLFLLMLVCIPITLVLSIVYQRMTKTLKGVCK